MSSRFLALVCLLVLLLPAGASGDEPATATLRRTTVSSLLAEDAPRYLVCAHRGAYYTSPLGDMGNTLRAIREAVGSGADLVEIDVELTKDHHAVVCHDDWPRRRTLRHWQRGRGLLTLAEALAWGRGRTVYVLDMKTPSTDIVARVVREAGAQDRVILYCNDEAEYDRAREHGPGLYKMVRAHDPEAAYAWAARDDPRILVVHGDYDWMRPDVVARIRAMGKRTFANSYKLSRTSELFGAERTVGKVFARGIDVAQTNHPSTAVRARDKALRRARQAAGEPVER